jgi:membrane-anchored protein YejM (alkaline phosphatase superfamily)
MAEIKIEQKKPIWPWLLVGLVIVGLLVYFLVFRDNSENTEAVAEPDSITNTSESDLLGIKENNNTVAAYVSFVENNKEKMSLDHEYTNEALVKLIDATDAMANQVGYDVQADLQKARDFAKMITKDSFETTHADNVRKADDMVANVLQNIQEAKYPELTNEVTALKSASESIKPGVLTLDQKDAVKNYFAQAADLLQKMN